MSEEPLEGLDPKLDALLESERHADAPTEALGRVWSRIGAIGVGGGGRSGTRLEWTASHVAGVAAAAFAVGGVAGAAVHASVERAPVERVVYVDRAARPAPLVSASPSPPEPAPEAVQAPVAVPRPMPVAAPSASTSIAAERALIDRARAALSSGDASDALVLLESHVRGFPRPQLKEEREAIRIQSLVTLGRYEEARAAAAQLKAAAPGSLFIPAIEASLGSIP